MRQWAWLAFGLACVAGTAQGADEKSLKNLVAPPPAVIGAPLAGIETQPVRFARLVVQLRPEPWALVTVGSHMGPGNEVVMPDTRLVSWKDGEQVVKTSSLSDIFYDELKRAGAGKTGANESVFSDGGAADLQVGVRITEMAGRFCKYCFLGRGRPMDRGLRNEGAVGSLFQP